jgi:hypothetical protein
MWPSSGPSVEVSFRYFIIYSPWVFLCDVIHGGNGEGGFMAKRNGEFEIFDVFTEKRKIN